MADTEKSFLDHAGSVVSSVIKHVPGRGVLWAFIGLVVGVVFVVISFGIGLLVMDRGALILGYLAAIPIAIPFLGAALFGMHGLHRGAARAALELEQKYGLSDWVTSRVMNQVVALVGGPVSNLPLAQLEEKVKTALDQYAKADEGKGIGAWVVRWVKKKVMKKLETFLLAAYREEQKKDGSGGGVSLEKVFAPVKKQLSEGLADFVMGPLNKQLAIFMTLYVLIAGGWWFWLFLLVRLLFSATPQH